MDLSATINRLAVDSNTYDKGLSYSTNYLLHTDQNAMKHSQADSNNGYHNQANHQINNRVDK